MGFEPHSVAGSALETCLPAPAEGASPLAHSPRKGLTPFEIPLSWIQILLAVCGLERAMGFEPTTTSLGS